MLTTVTLTVKTVSNLILNYNIHFLPVIIPSNLIISNLTSSITRKLIKT